jgi:hypothetical protein
MVTEQRLWALEPAVMLHARVLRGDQQRALPAALVEAEIEA